MLLVGILAVPASYSIISFAGLRTTVVWSGSGVLALGNDGRLYMTDMILSRSYPQMHLYG